MTQTREINRYMSKHNVIDNPYLFLELKFLENQEWFCNFELQTLRELKLEIDLDKNVKSKIQKQRDLDTEIRYLQEQLTLTRLAIKLKQIKE